MSMLNPTKKLEIEMSVKELLSDHYPSLDNITLPIDLEPFLKQYGIKLEFVEFKEPSISGAYDRITNTIYVAKDDSYTRKSFTIAHELGHLILHKDKEREIFYRQNIVRIPEETKEEEKEANWFAAALLMPEKLIKKYWDLTHDIDKLAVIFGTSPTAVYFRLKNLHLIT